MLNYQFPGDVLEKVKVKENSVVLVLCGSFNPITHLRMFEMAKSFLKQKRGLDCIAGFISPVNDAYKKKGLVRSDHRVKMCQIALRTQNVEEPNFYHQNEWIRVDPWESFQPKAQDTLDVLNDHFAKSVKEILKKDFEKVKVMFLCGGDLLNTFTDEEDWGTEDVTAILKNHGLVCVERIGFDLKKTVFENDLLFKLRQHIIIVPQMIRNDISSTKMRSFVQRGFSTKYLVNDEVREYIDQHKLFNKKKEL